MIDRNVQFPNRYQLQKVAGTDDIYDIIPAPGEIQNEGTLINKSTLLTDAVASMFGFGASAVPNDMFNVLTHAGDLHVWKRTIDGVTDYPVHPNRNAYQEGSDAQPAGYTLGAVQSGSFKLGYTAGVTDQYYTSDSVNVSDDGIVSLVSPNSVTVNTSQGIETLNANLLGKFIMPDTGYGGAGTVFPEGVIYFIPKEATISVQSAELSVFVSSRQPVTGYPAIPAGTTIEYMGQVGNKARIITGSYVGTGTSGSSYPTRLKIPEGAKIFGVYCETRENVSTPQSVEGMQSVPVEYLKNGTLTVNVRLASSPTSVVGTVVFSLSENSDEISWYNNKTNATLQCNYSGTIYDYYFLM